MGDRIAVLESKVAEMQVAMEQMAMKHFSLKRAFTAICGNMAGALGITPDNLRAAHEHANRGTIWFLFPGLSSADSEPSERFNRQSDTASKELDEIFTWLMNGLESYKAAQPPEPVDRFVAMANAVSMAGVQLAENQRYRLANVLVNVTQKLSNAAAIDELQGVLIFTDVHGEHCNDPEEKARFLGLSEFIRQRIRDIGAR